MTNRNSIPGSEKEILDYIDDSTDQIDEHRLSALKETENTQLIKQEIIQREKSRLEAKYGTTYPEVQEAETRLVYNKQLFTGLSNEIQKSSVKADPIEPTSWRVHGRVFGKSGPVPGVTVFFADQNKRWIEILGSSCTTAAGDYSLTVPEQLIDKMEKAQPLFLAASDKNKKILYISDEAFSPQKGLVIYKDIYLREETCILPPGDDTIPTKAWVIKGKVTDKNDRALKGLTISLHDQDFKYAQALGTTLTDENGNFEKKYEVEAFQILFEKKPEIYLDVSDSKGNKLYSTEKGVLPEAGHVEELIIKIDPAKKARKQ